MKKIKFLLLVAIAAISLTSCLNPKKLNKWVATKYEDGIPAAKKSNYVSVISNLPTLGDKLSSSTSKTSNLLPLIIYWQLDYKITCNLNPQIAINGLSTKVSTDKRLQQKLGDQKIELTIEKIPATFTILDKGHLITLGIINHGWDIFSIMPKDKEMVVSYKIIKSDNSVTKTGVITISNPDEGVKVGMFRSIKNKTMGYLTDYDTNISLMSKNFVDKLLLEL